MKKIVALVLSLVMALSLCTVAFAADEMYVKYDGDFYELEETKAGKNNIAGYTDDKGWNYVKCDEKDDGACPVYDTDEPLPGDKPLFYVKADRIFFDIKGTAVKEAKWSCTSDEHAEGYVDADGKYWVDAEDEENPQKYMLVDGKIIAVDTDKSFIKGSHLLYQYKTKEVSTGVYVYKCAFCGKEFNCAISKAYAGTNYVEYQVDETMLALLSGDRPLDEIIQIGQEFGVSEKVVKYWVKVADSLGLLDNPDALDPGTLYIIGAASTTDKDGVTSAKTFDAGIAMYVGMSLLSVAGGAVVIGKKKEF